MAIIDQSQVPSDYSLGDKVYNRTEEVTNDRYSDGTTLNRIYRREVLDENGDPTGDHIETIGVIKERGANIFYDETNYESSPDGDPSWQRASDEFEVSAVAGVAYEIRKKNIIFGITIKRIRKT